MFEVVDISNGKVFILDKETDEVEGYNILIGNILNTLKYMYKNSLLENKLVEDTNIFSLVPDSIYEFIIQMTSEIQEVYKDIVRELARGKLLGMDKDMIDLFSERLPKTIGVHELTTYSDSMCRMYFSMRLNNYDIDLEYAEKKDGFKLEDVVWHLRDGYLKDKYMLKLKRTTLNSNNDGFIAEDCSLEFAFSTIICCIKDDEIMNMKSIIIKSCEDMLIIYKDGTTKTIGENIKYSKEEYEIGKEIAEFIKNKKRESNNTTDSPFIIRGRF